MSDAHLRNENLEALVLAACLADPAAIAAANLAASDFHSPVHRQIWTTLTSMHFAGEVADTALLTARLLDEKHKGAADMVTTIAKLVHRPGNIEAHAEKLRTYGARRRVIELCDAIHRRIETAEDGDDLLAWLAEAARAVYLRAGRVDATGWDAAKEGAETWFADADRIAKGGQPSGVPTGMANVDRLCGGLPKSVVSVVGARPAVGKSSVALNIALHAASKGRPVHFFTLEDSILSFGQRILANMCRVSVSDIRAGAPLNGLHMDLPQYLRTHIMISPAHGWTAERIAREARVQMARNKTELVIVDYLQLMSHADAGKLSRNDLIGRDMEVFATLAGQEGIALLVLSQLSRNLEHRSDPRPVLADLRDSGNIEQVGKLIMALSANHDDTGELTSELTVSVLKNHQGMTGDFSVHFNRAQCRIS